MASSHLLRVLRPACNCRQIYLSRTLPLYKHRQFFSDAPVRAARKKADGVERTRRKKISITQLTDEDEAALNVSKLNLPPIDKWRQYFAVVEAQRLRTFIRNPETARMLAEAFVPEGSKDLIIIEAAPGMPSHLYTES